MKTSLSYIFCALALSLTALTGTLSTPALAADGNNLTAADYKKMSDHVFMHGGILMQVKDGELSTVEEIVTCYNGTSIAPDGSITRADRTTGQLKDGEVINMDGQIINREATYKEIR